MKKWVLSTLAVVVVVPAVTLAVVAARFRPKWEREDPATVRREVAMLTKQRDSLRVRVLDAASTSDLLDERPAGDIVIGLPTPFVDAMVQSVIAGWFNEVELRLPQMRVRKSGDVRAKLGIFGRRKVGEFNLDIVLDDVRGRLQPDAPTLKFGGDVISLAVPVRLAGGTGVARVKAEWISTGITSSVCGNMTVTHDVTGQVRARNYMARGRIVLSAVEGTVRADPDFPDLAIRLFVDPSRASVAALDSILDARGGLCGYAVDRSRASERIQALVARGFRVKIPQRFFRQISLPVAVETSVPVQNRDVQLEVTPNGLAVTASTVWIAADVSTKRPTPKVP
ncbi:MAG: hypothetical protein U5K74_07240 [Gemmatimonadaceae bacterium]|nr:hypothetical protein [Gemmatimonadaceae bacterium]